MIVSARIKGRYDELSPRVVVLQKLVREQLAPWCEREHFGFQDRIKALESVAEKLESGRVTAWEELDDVYAATVIVPSLRDEPNVIERLAVMFERVRLRSRADTRTPPDVFRFDCPRFVARLRPTPENEGSPLLIIPFEVQVRTAFEHAWATITHPLTYKARHVDWRNQRLAAALRATVEQMDIAIAGFEETAGQVLPGLWEESVVKGRILDGYRAMFEAGRLPSELEPAAWSRHVDNVYALCAAEAWRRRPGRRPQATEIGRVADAALIALQEWVASTPAAQVPRSLSLFQTTLGVLCEARIVSKGVEFNAHGVEDIADLFPGAGQVLSSAAG